MFLLKQAINSPIKVVQKSKELNGIQRYVAENLLTSNQCMSLIYLVKLFATLGDGYVNNKTPHTAKEFFGGIAFTRLAFLVDLGLVDVKYLETVVNVTERAQNHIQNYFNEKKLYFSYTHLVCRSAIPGSQDNRTEFSHTVHADNCNLFPTGECERAYPSYTERDYSAIIYLNSNIEGGEFVFVSDYKGEDLQSAVNPKCGRMVAFSSGAENLHAVKAVKKGTRCAIAIWFTLNSTEVEDREYAHTLIKDHS